MEGSGGVKPLVVLEASGLEALGENRWEGSGGINLERSGSEKPVEVDVEEGGEGGINWQGSGKVNSGMTSSIAIEFS